MEKNDFAIGTLPGNTKDADNPLLWLMLALVLAVFGTNEGFCVPQKLNLIRKTHLMNSVQFGDCSAVLI